MDPIPLCQKTILLTESNHLQLYRKHATLCAAALAPSIPACPAVAEAIGGKIPFGPVFSSIPGPKEPSVNYPDATETLIERYKEQLRPVLSEQTDFFYLRSTDSFASLRCAVLAATDLCGQTLLAEIQIAPDGLLPFGTHPTAAIGVLQRIGVSTVILNCEDPDVLEHALMQCAPHARISLGIRIHPTWLTDARHFPCAEVFMPKQPEDTPALVTALEHWHGFTSCIRDEDDFLMAPDGTRAHFIHPTVDISAEIPLDSHLSERLLEAEDDSGAIKLVFECEEDLIRFEEEVFMLTRPVCLCAEQPELLERALRIYPGLALYDGTWELEPRILKYFSEKYGMICL